MRHCPPSCRRSGCDVDRCARVVRDRHRVGLVEVLSVNVPSKFILPPVSMTIDTPVPPLSFTEPVCVIVPADTSWTWIDRPAVLVMSCVKLTDDSRPCTSSAVSAAEILPLVLVTLNVPEPPTPSISTPSCAVLIRQVVQRGGHVVAFVWQDLHAVLAGSVARVLDGHPVQADKIEFSTRTPLACGVLNGAAPTADSGVADCNRARGVIDQADAVGGAVDVDALEVDRADRHADDLRPRPVVVVILLLESVTVSVPPPVATKPLPVVVLMSSGLALAAGKSVIVRQRYRRVRRRVEIQWRR